MTREANALWLYLYYSVCFCFLKTRAGERCQWKGIIVMLQCSEKFLSFKGEKRCNHGSEVRALSCTTGFINECS